MCNFVGITIHFYSATASGSVVHTIQNVKARNHSNEKEIDTFCIFGYFCIWLGFYFKAPNQTEKKLISIM